MLCSCSVVRDLSFVFKARTLTSYQTCSWIIIIGWSTLQSAVVPVSRKVQLNSCIHRDSFEKSPNAVNISFNVSSEHWLSLYKILRVCVEKKSAVNKSRNVAILASIGCQYRPQSTKNKSAVLKSILFMITMKFLMKNFELNGRFSIFSATIDWSCTQEVGSVPILPKGAVLRFDSSLI